MEPSPHLRRIALPVLVAAALGACAGEALKAQSGTVTMSVTEEGFVPAGIKLKKGEPVKLVITRKTDKTCATEIVIDEHQINQKLPLNQAVTVTFTPNKTGELRYGCAMNKMIGGVFVIE